MNKFRVTLYNGQICQPLENITPELVIEETVVESEDDLKYSKEVGKTINQFAKDVLGRDPYYTRCLLVKPDELHYYDIEHYSKFVVVQKIN